MGTIVALPTAARRVSAIAAAEFHYRNHTIRYMPKPDQATVGVDWVWWHNEHEDRCGSAASLARAKADIDDLEDSDDAWTGSTLLRDAAAFLAVILLTAAAVIGCMAVVGAP